MPKPPCPSTRLISKRCSSPSPMITLADLWTEHVAALRVWRGTAPLFAGTLKGLAPRSTVDEPGSWMLGLARTLRLVRPALVVHSDMVGLFDLAANGRWRGWGRGGACEMRAEDHQYHGRVACCDKMQRGVGARCALWLPGDIVLCTFPPLPPSLSLHSTAVSTSADPPSPVSYHARSHEISTAPNVSRVPWRRLRGFSARVMPRLLEGAVLGHLCAHSPTSVASTDIPRQARASS
mmetsp:Transcript_16488/g.41850  ORF Transcript_16488/g.41850 Transcript_16488/m.41850 type:complete len:236 (+) Transcript_16488:1640-2347(+)